MASSDCESNSSTGYCFLADERSDNESAQVVKPPMGSCAYIFEPYAAEKPAQGSKIPIVNEDIDRFQHHYAGIYGINHDEWYVDTPLNLLLYLCSLFPKFGRSIYFKK